jgi:hypothetical protein
VTMFGATGRLAAPLNSIVNVSQEMKNSGMVTEWIDEGWVKNYWFEGWRFVPFTRAPEYFYSLGGINIGNTVRRGRFALMEIDDKTWMHLKEQKELLKNIKHNY